ncbi:MULTISPECIES: L,D-transpeptidase family protein [Agrobacterium]|jgi:peptidoglycan hydrolase-like protein with peptidoglycan-binding domain|uniref:L,D-transpeptidase family protein n=1 Tax=Agrobacterium tumefaciens TaxID=358 RepID=A0AAJ4N1X9_AGRTU|nr:MULTISPECIES: L,D-transpeptidase family protein [Agrobacterium]MEA1840959.1 L,D-transpeptidase family protein [Agrobacterium tumefaciens]MRH95845.1 L,D-transpeptidase family protein [Agrobacterium tumefaciens]NTA41851.1 L,D-transpeptidase family protein [Agrobacterium tumefaciens]NTA58192.1 L,D-transpeptidase family protein [Agrobacterium tumefaciens]QTG13248.1 L,D-transpeptidase family protein [Agrobacterium tumefaciens]
MSLRFRLLTGMLSASILAFPALAADNKSLQIVVSKSDQSLALYENGEIVATSKVSTGKAGHETPSGIFSILEKRKYHESNIYSAAPMPFMQRLTWSGIALHEGKVPNYPASHGCVRLPSKFAQSLFGETRYGVHVIITDRPVSLRSVQHSALFEPRDDADDGKLLLSDVELRPATFDAALGTVEVAVNEKTQAIKPMAKGKEPSPLRILITRRGEREKVMDIQAVLTRLGFDAGAPDGYTGEMTISAVNGFKRWKGLKTTGPLLTDDFVAALYASADEDHPPNGQIMVRQDFKPLFEAAIDIKDPEVALGTHFFEAVAVNRAAGTAEWNGVTLENRLPAAARKRLGITVTEAPGGFDQLSAVLGRLEIPAEIRSRIEKELSTGSSITVSDLSHQMETGMGTDFITVTKEGPV